MEILNREVKTEGDKLIIIKTTKESFTKDRVRNELHNIKTEKEYLIQQSKQIKKQYDECVARELEMEAWLKENEEEEFEEFQEIGD